MMQFIEIGNVILNLECVESVDKRSANVVHVVSASGQAYSFEGPDAEALRNYFAVQQPSSPPVGPVLEKTYPCGCHATGGRDLPEYCPTHGVSANYQKDKKEIHEASTPAA